MGKQTSRILRKCINSAMSLLLVTGLFGSAGLGTVSAEQETPEYEIRLEINDPAGGTASLDKTKAKEGETVTLTYTENVGYKVNTINVVPGISSDSVTGDDTSESSEGEGKKVEFEMPASNVTVKIAFSKIWYDITAGPFSNGEISVNSEIGANKAAFGDLVNLQVIPDENYRLKNGTLSVLQGETPVEVQQIETNPNMFTFTMPNGSVTVNAEFVDDVKPTVTLNKTALGLAVENEETLTASVEPDTTEDKTINWASDNTEVATVDSNGKVKAIAAGTATVKASLQSDPSVYAECIVTVSAAQRYNIDLHAPGNAAFSCIENAAADEKVIVNVSLTKGYGLLDIYYNDGGKSVYLVKESGSEGEYQYSFTMPAHDITIFGTTEPLRDPREVKWEIDKTNDKYYLKWTEPAGDTTPSGYAFRLVNLSEPSVSSALVKVPAEEKQYECKELIDSLLSSTNTDSAVIEGRIYAEYETGVSSETASFYSSNPVLLKLNVEYDKEQLDVTGDNWYRQGDRATVSATPKPHYEFEKFEDSTGSEPAEWDGSTPSFSFTMAINHYQKIIAKAVEETHRHGDLIYTKWDDSTGLPTVAGNYYLSQNVILQSQWIVPSGETRLCLNGHKIIADFGGDNTQENNAAIKIPYSFGSDTYKLHLENCEEVQGMVTHAGGKTGTGIYVGSGSAFYMEGGTITGNNASNGNYGGGIWTYGNVYLGGGTISGNSTGMRGGGVYAVNDGTINVSENAQVFGNTCNGVSENVYLQNGKKITVTGTMGADAKIGVTTETKPVGDATIQLTSSDGKLTSLSHFVSDDSQYGIFWNSNRTEAVLRNLSAPFQINIASEIEHGTVTSNKEDNKASSGEEVVLTLTPEATYFPGTVTVMSGTDAVETQKHDDYRFSFIMPQSDVNVTATFKEAAACVIDGSTTTYYETLEAAATAWKDRTTLKLLKDAETASQLVTASGEEGNQIYNLDLNGKTISANHNDSVIKVSGNTTLIIDDSSSEKTGSITHAMDGSNRKQGRGVDVDTAGYLRMKAGSIKNNQSTTIGGGVYLNSNSTFVMSGGSISGNRSMGGYRGGGVYVNSGAQFVMSGGSISYNNSGQVGGGVSVSSNGSFTLSDGSITGNTANTSGGGIYINNEAAVCITGGVVQNNVSNDNNGGGGVYNFSNNFHISGSPIISNNTAGQNKSNNVQQGGINKPIVVDGYLTPGASIGVSVTGTPEIITSEYKTKGNEQDPSTFFKSDSSEYSIIWDTEFKEAVVAQAYNVEVSDTPNGSITSNRDTAYAGATVKLKIDPKPGYELDTLSVNPTGQGSITPTKTDATYDFTMPAANVQVVGTFKEITAAQPVIQTQPSHTGSETYGTESATRTLSIAATVSDGGELTYQWYSNTSESTEDGTPIDGATAAQFSIPLNENAGTYHYYCVVTNNRGTVTATKTSNSVSVTIAQKAVVVTGIKADDKTYDKNTGATLNYKAAVIDGKITDDDLSVSAVGTFRDYNAGNNKVVEISALTLTGSDKDNYVLAQSGQQNETNASILPKEVAVSGISASKHYDGSVIAYLNCSEVTIDGRIEGDELNFTAEGTYENKNVGNNKTVNITSYSLTGGSASNYKLNDVQRQIDTGVITPIEAFLSWRNTTFRYDNQEHVPFVFVANKVTGDDVSVASVSGAAVNAGTYTAKATGLKGDDSENYTFPSETEKNTKEFTIQPAPVTVTADDKSSQYGTDIVDLTCTISGTYYSEPQVSLSTTATKQSNVGDYPIKVTVTADSNYEFTTVEGKYTITNAPMSVTAKGYSGVYDGVAHGITVTVDPVTAGTVYYGNEPLTAENYNTKGSTVQITQTDVGSRTVYYYVKAENHESPTGVSGSKTITITKAPITPGVNITGWVYGEEAHTPTITEDGNPGEGTVTYKYKKASDETYSSTVPTDAGLYTVQAEIGASGNYERGTAYADFEIAQKEVSISWQGTSLEYNGSLQAPAATASNIKEGDTVTVHVSGGQKNAGTYTATAAALSNDNYKLPSSNTTPFTITQKEIGLEWSETSFTYDSTVHVPTATATGLIDGDTCTVTVSGGQTNAGENYTATATEVDNPNYKLPVNVTQSFTIAKASITPTVMISGWTYGETKSIPVVGGNDGGGTVTFSYKAEGDQEYSETVPVNAGTYSIKAVIAPTQNYNGGEATSDFTISKATPVITDAQKPKAVEGLEADGAAHNLITPPETPVDKYTVHYSSDGTNWKETIPTGSAAGNYTVHVKYVTTDPNYADFDGEDITVSIIKVTYSIVDGDGQTWTKGGKTAADFRFARSVESEGRTAFVLFSMIQIDGKEVDASNYQKTEGSVIISLKPEYLETLTIGGHTLKANFKEGRSVTASFTIKKQSSGGGEPSSDSSEPSKPAKPVDNVVTCQMAGYPSNYVWNEAAKACQAGYLDAGGNFHPYRKASPNTYDPNTIIFAYLAMIAITIACFCGVKLLHEDWEV